MNNKVEVAGINTSSLETLPDGRAAELMERMKNGDRAARCEFITGNLRLVLAEIGKLRLRSDCADDLFQAGCVGLIKAADNFDPGQNVRFSTYAVPMIDGEIRRYLRQSCVLKVGRSTKDLAYRALTAKEQLSKSNGSEPDTAEIASFLGRDEADVRRALDAIADPLSLYEPAGGQDGDDISLSDRIADSDGEDWIDRIALKEALKKCTPREKRLLSIRYYLGRTQTEAAAELGISQAQICRLERGAIDKLRKNME